GGLGASTGSFVGCDSALAERSLIGSRDCAVPRRNVCEMKRNFRWFLAVDQRRNHRRRLRWQGERKDARQHTTFVAHRRRAAGGGGGGRGLPQASGGGPTPYFPAGQPGSRAAAAFSARSSRAGRPRSMSAPCSFSSVIEGATRPPHPHAEPAGAEHGGNSSL